MLRAKEQNSNCFYSQCEAVLNSTPKQNVLSFLTTSFDAKVLTLLLHIPAWRQDIKTPLHSARIDSYSVTEV